jgi:flavin-dependent dehydrogenase
MADPTLSDTVYASGIPVRIAGAGLAGLTTAIHLARQGHHVEVFDRKPDSGRTRLPDWDAAENWTTKEDFLVLLERWGLARDFEHLPSPELEIYDPAGTRYTLKTAQPLVYLVRRGPQRGSLEQALKTQALDHGVRVYYDRSCSRPEVDVWATGGNQRRGFFLDVGLTFCTSHPDIVMGLIDAQAAPKAYAYLIITKGQGKLSVLLTRDFAQARRLLGDAISTLRKARWFDMDEVRLTSGFGGQLRALDHLVDGSIAVGEAAGFQDYMWGFGIRHALLSAYWAAQAIDKGLDYPALAAEHICPLVRSSIVNRLLYDWAGDGTYSQLIRYLSRSRDLARSLRLVYRDLPLRHLLWPIASARYR